MQVYDVHNILNLGQKCDFCVYVTVKTGGKV